MTEGRSNRKYTDENNAADVVKNADYDPYEHKGLGITAKTKLLGKTKFEELLGALINKPQGKPTLVFRTDKRPEISSAKMILRSTTNISKNYVNLTKVITVANNRWSYANVWKQSQSMAEHQSIV